jgi:putative intracellular protease/amidase
MKVVIPLFDRFTALDAIGPYEVLTKLPGAEVTFVAAEAGPVTTDTGVLTVQVDTALAEVTEADVLVVPGGPGTRTMMADQQLVDWVRAIDAGSSWTTSVCTGSLALGAAGLLEGTDATTHWACVDLLESTGATYTAERVVVRDKVITAAGVSSGIDMALTLAGLLAGHEVAQAIQLGIEYDPQPPYDSGAVHKADPGIVELVRALSTDPDPAPASAG